MTARTRLVKRDCAHPVARHQHGTRLAYIRDECGCEPCRAANTASERARNRAKLYGRYDALVDAEPVRAHVRSLAANGVGLKRITRLTGVSGGVLTRLVYGYPRPDGTRRAPSNRVAKRTAERILSLPLTPDIAAGGVRVDPTGTRRRLQALMCMGWSKSKLAAHLGMAVANFGKTMQAANVLASTDRAVRDLYDKLWDTPAPQLTHRDKIAYSRAITYAAANSFAPPLAWDEDTIDNPAAKPAHRTARATIREIDEIAVERAMRGDKPPLTKQERAEAVRRLTKLGYSARQIGERLGVASRTVQRRRSAA